MIISIISFYFLPSISLYSSFSPLFQVMHSPFFSFFFNLSFDPSLSVILPFHLNSIQYIILTPIFAFDKQNLLLALITHHSSFQNINPVTICPPLTLYPWPLFPSSRLFHFNPNSVRSLPKPLFAIAIGVHYA